MNTENSLQLARKTSKIQIKDFLPVMTSISTGPPYETKAL